MAQPTRMKSLSHMLFGFLVLKERLDVRGSTSPSPLYLGNAIPSATQIRRRGLASMHTCGFLINTQLLSSFWVSSFSVDFASHHITDTVMEKLSESRHFLRQIKRKSYILWHAPPNPYFRRARVANYRLWCILGLIHARLFLASQKQKYSTTPGLQKPIILAVGGCLPTVRKTFASWILSSTQVRRQKTKHLVVSLSCVPGDTCARRGRDVRHRWRSFPRGGTQVMSVKKVNPIFKNSLSLRWSCKNVVCLLKIILGFNFSRYCFLGDFFPRRIGFAQDRCCWCHPTPTGSVSGFQIPNSSLAILAKNCVSISSFPHKLGYSWNCQLQVLTCVQWTVQTGNHFPRHFLWMEMKMLWRSMGTESHFFKERRPLVTPASEFPSGEQRCMGIF